jgi:hypothetical protein
MSEQAPNQYAMTMVKGHLDLSSSNSITCEVDAVETTQLIPGQAVKLSNSFGGLPRIVKCAFDNDVVFGFINFTPKDKYFVKGSRCEVSLFGNVMYMEASAAIARGAMVALVLSGSKVVTQSGVQTVIGVALDKATLPGNLIRVIIQTPFKLTVGAGGVEGYTKDFIISDWIFSSPYYYIDFTHNLDTLTPLTVLYESTSEVYYDKTEVISSNLVRIFIIGTPFNGSVKII